MRTLLQIHRYLGVAGGALMLMWCATGFVMMYVKYPRLEETKRLSALVPIDWHACCAEPTSALGNEPVDDFQIEMLAGHAVLSRHGAQGAHLIDLVTGATLGPVSAARASDIARAYAPGAGATPRLLALSDQDIWTVAGHFALDRPLYRFALNDASKTEVYVSSVTGQIVQVTTGRERFWNWLGPIPHWLYFYELRRHPKQWQAVVIATSLVGCFLTLSGLCLAVRRWPWPNTEPRVREPGVRRWHRASSLIFGLFALTWIGSGLLSVEPWGLLKSSSLEPARLHGPAIPGQKVSAAIHQLAKTLRASRFVSLEFAPFEGEPYFIASAADGSRHRLDASGLPALLTERDFSRLALRLESSAPVLYLTQEDRYLFSHRGDQVQLPAYRLVVDGHRQTYIYLDALSAALEAEADPNGKAYRWIQGIHRFDLLSSLRARPTWDLLVLLLLSGVSAVCITGCCLAYRKRAPKAD
jgi:uncharacterized iron-regulated membrane protein